ncbi:hypothetical protein SDC9_197019 [bioreactor metagenome]|uniref:Uncharacterized protein n=1 Tax=bioreactor metagenome TaxID=1076179 RepID=A0A645IDL3_9ZZZZ
MLYLILWFVVVSAVYYTAVSLEFIWIVPIYIGIVCVACVLFLLVNGGIGPIIKAEHKKEDTAHKKYVLDKSHQRLSRRTKFRRFRLGSQVSDKTTQTEADIKTEAQERPNPLSLDDMHRELYSKIILIIGIPVFIVFLIDYMLILFNIQI